MHQLGNHKVKFTYFSWHGDKPERGDQPQGCTCEIFCDDSPMVAWGVSRCHPEDNFQYSVARKLAFAKALDSGFAREARSELWNLYFQQFPKDRVKIGK